MPNYRRNRVPGGTFFFTVNPLDRRSNLLVRHIDALRAAVRRVRAGGPFHIDAWVVLPDHMHCLGTLPQDRVCQIVARCRTAIRGGVPPRRARHLTAPLLGAHDPRLPGLCRSFRLHPLQPGQAWSRQTPGRLAAFDVSPLRCEQGSRNRAAIIHECTAW